MAVHVPPPVKAVQDRIARDLLELVNRYERRVYVMFTAVGMGFITGIGIAWGVIPWMANPPLISLAAVVTFVVFLATGLIGNGLVNFLVAAAAARFDEIFPRGSPERSTAIGMLSAMTSPYHLAEKLQAALAVPIGSQVAAEEQIQAALHELEPPPPVPSAPASAPPARPRGHFIPLDVQFETRRMGPSESRPDEEPLVPLEPLQADVNEQDAGRAAWPK